MTPRRSPEIRHWFTKAAGVSFDNDDGTSRQEILARCEPLERLRLIHQADNPYDRNAIKLCRGNGEQIGYLERRQAADVVRRAEDGYRFAGYILEIRGGTWGAPTLGARLLIVQAAADVSDDQAQAYLDRCVAAGVPATRRATLLIEEHRAHPILVMVIASVLLLLALGIVAFSWWQHRVLDGPS